MLGFWRLLWAPGVVLAASGGSWWLPEAPGGSWRVLALFHGGSWRLLATRTAGIRDHPRRLAFDTFPDGSHRIPHQTVRIREHLGRLESHATPDGSQELPSWSLQIPPLTARIRHHPRQLASATTPDGSHPIAPSPASYYARSAAPTLALYARSAAPSSVLCTSCSPPPRTMHDPPACLVLCTIRRRPPPYYARSAAPHLRSMRDPPPPPHSMHDLRPLYMHGINGKYVIYVWHVMMSYV